MYCQHDQDKGMRAAVEDGSYLVRNGPEISFGELEDYVKFLYNKRSRVDVVTVNSPFIADLSEYIGETGLPQMIVLLREFFDEERIKNEYHVTYLYDFLLPRTYREYGSESR